MSKQFKPFIIALLYLAIIVWSLTDISGDADIVAKTKGGRLSLTLGNNVSLTAATTVAATKRE